MRISPPPTKTPLMKLHAGQPVVPETVYEPAGLSVELAGHELVVAPGIGAPYAVARIRQNPSF